MRRPSRPETCRGQARCDPERAPRDRDLAKVETSRDATLTKLTTLTTSRPDPHNKSQGRTRIPHGQSPTKEGTRRREPSDFGRFATIAKRQPFLHPTPKVDMTKRELEDQLNQDVDVLGVVGARLIRETNLINIVLVESSCRCHMRHPPPKGLT